MFSKEDLENANKSMETVDIEKGKRITKYVMVNERVKAFRSICPAGGIETEIIDMSNGIVTIRAIIRDERGLLIATGIAQEKETSSFINKTSYIENCETSAVGRALGFAGIGIDGSMASAEEVANAIMNQNKPTKEEKEDQKKTEAVGRQLIDNVKVESLMKKVFNDGVKPEKLLKLYKVEKFDQLSEKQFSNIVNNWEAIVKSCS